MFSREHFSSWTWEPSLRGCADESTSSGGRGGAGWGLCRLWSLRGLRPGLARHPPVTASAPKDQTRRLGLVSEYPTPQNAAACPRISPKYLQNEMQTVHNSWILRYWWPGLARYRPVTACTNPDSLYFRRRAKLAALQPSLLQSVQRVMNLELVGKLYICDKNSVQQFNMTAGRQRIASKKMLKAIVPQFFLSIFLSIFISHILNSNGDKFWNQKFQV